MTFAELKKHSIARFAPMKELPIEVRFGADLMFTEHMQLRADRLLRIDLGLEAPAGKTSQP